ncbi:MAG: DUF697 domain-containing protein [Clostridia bacterium]|nr:DUF697 domain-containing protein [Clostridia bacterium]
MRKKEKITEEQTPKTALVPDKKLDDSAFSESISGALKQKNEKGFFFAIIAVAAVVLLLVIGALADILTLCFQVNQVFGYCALAATAVLVGIFIVRPIVKVLGARFFVTDITADNFDLAVKKNYRALKDVASALVEYHENPNNARFRYLSEQTLSELKTALSNKDKQALKTALKQAYATDVAKCVNALIWKSSGKVFLTTSISQNDKIDALSVLLVNLSLVKQIVGIYGYRPNYAKLFRVYFIVMRSALLAYGMQNVNWFNVFGKFFSGVAKKIPFLDTVVDSAVQGTVSAFMTVLVGYKTKKYLCSDYKKQENLEIGAKEVAGKQVTDDEVQIAVELAKEIRNKNKDKLAE